MERKGSRAEPDNCRSGYVVRRHNFNRGTHRRCNGFSSSRNFYRRLRTSRHGSDPSAWDLGLPHLRHCANHRLLRRCARAESRYSLCLRARLRLALERRLATGRGKPLRPRLHSVHCRSVSTSGVRRRSLEAHFIFHGSNGANSSLNCLTIPYYHERQTLFAESYQQPINQYRSLFRDSTGGNDGGRCYPAGNFRRALRCRYPRSCISFATSSTSSSWIATTFRSVVLMVSSCLSPPNRHSRA